jgi:hypothetical protein
MLFILESGVMNYSLSILEKGGGCDDQNGPSGLRQDIGVPFVLVYEVMNSNQQCKTLPDLLSPKNFLSLHVKNVSCHHNLSRLIIFLGDVLHL